MAGVSQTTRDTKATGDLERELELLLRQIDVGLSPEV
jgi:hypothetical protein